MKMRNTVVSSKGGKICLFVAVDRRAMDYMIEKIASKNAEEMQKPFLKISENFRIKDDNIRQWIRKRPYTRKPMNSLDARVFSADHTAAKIKALSKTETKSYGNF